MASGPETRLLNKMRDAGKKEYGIRLVMIKYHGDQYAQAGVSDLLCCLDGVFVACEVKAPESYPVNGKPSVDKALAEGPTIKQRSFVAKVIAAGGVGGFAATVEQFMALLAQASDKRYRVVEQDSECECSFVGEHRVSSANCIIHG